MQSFIELKQMLDEVNDRHKLLRSNFKTFHELIKNQVEHPSLNAKYLVISSLIDNEFYIEMADRKLRFKFSTSIRKDINILYGYIDCYLIDSSGMRYLNLREFEFNTKGVSSYKAVQSDPKELSISIENDALRIVSNFIYKSLCMRQV